MRALDHVDLESSDIVANSVPVPDPDSSAPWWAIGAGESAWDSGTAYVVDDYVVLASTGRVYRAIAASTNKSPNLYPLLWFDAYPVNALAWADMKTSTYTYAASPFEITVSPGAISDVDLEGLLNVDTARLRVWDESGGTLIYDQTLSTFYWGGDLWVSYYFDLPYQRDRVKFSEVPSSATAEMTLTLESYDAGALRVSQIAFGRFVELGLAEYGLEMQLKNFGSVEFDIYGNSTLRDGLVVVDLTGSDFVSASDANRVAEFVRRYRNRVMVWEASDDPLYDYLSTTGIAECSIRAENTNSARMNFTVSGISA